MGTPVKKLCIVAHIDNADYFQWYVAFKKYGAKYGIDVSFVSSMPVQLKIHNNFKDDPFWQPIRDADYIFAYATRRRTRCEPTGINWWTLPILAKALMKPSAKMIAQYDDEFMWLFDPKHVWWDVNDCPPPTSDPPEKFFKETGILEIPDAHIVVRARPFSDYTRYTTKPVFKVLLPQLCRYRLQKYSENHEQNTIAMMLHSIKNSSVSGILENIIRPNNWSVSIFNGSLNEEQVKRFRMSIKLPPNSSVYPRIDYEAYTDLLWRYCSIGLDDNTGYQGWSRFAMECAVTYIPCVGSTEAVYDLFPELHTSPQDYALQTELINRLKTDKKFYSEMAELGHKRGLELFNEEDLVKTILYIFEKIGTSPSTVTYKDIPHSSGLYVADRLQARNHP
jgi:hypothetical protein